MERFATHGWNYPINLRRGQHCIASSLKFTVAKIIDITVICLIDLATVSISHERADMDIVCYCIHK